MSLALVTDNTAENPRAVMGGNNPPSTLETVIAEAAEAINPLYMESKNWADGTPIDSDAQAAAVATLDKTLLEADKTWDAKRVELKKPHDDAAAAVQAAFKPWLAKIAAARKALKEVQAAYLVKKQREQEEKARLEREEAERQRREAEEALRASAGNLEAREQAEALAQAAKEQEKLATRAEKAKPQIQGAGRAVGLRKTYTARVDDYRAFQRFMAENYEADFKKWFDEQAQRLVNNGLRSIPGVTIEEGAKV